VQGETDATLTFWNFCADLESKGLKRTIEIADVMKELGAKAPVAIVGYTFDAGWAAKQKTTVDRFLDATHKAKALLASSNDEWWRLAPRIGVREASALAIYRQRYRDGIFRRPIAEEEADAAGLYRVLAEIGGAELVGSAKELAPGTFYRPGTTP
jgi:NitT/TauT family transport system substrate-binding protein